MKYLYRVTATYPDGRVWRRDYQSTKAANERHDRLLDTTGVTVRVTIVRSNQVTFPDEVTL